MKINFIHLRLHTSYSLGESSLTIKNLIPLLKKYNMPALAITDSNNLFGAREFSYILSENGIKPIIGMEIKLYYSLNSNSTAANSSVNNTKLINFYKNNNSYTSEIYNNIIYGSVVLLVKNEIGYLNLLKLHKELYNNSNPNKNISVDFYFLLKHSDGLILLSGGNDGFLAKVLLENNSELTHLIVNLLKEVYLDNFYIELNRYPNTEQINLEDKFLELAKRYILPIVATANPFFSCKEDFEANDILMCIGQGKLVNDYERFILSEEQYFKNQDEMVELFNDLPEALENTVNIAKRCNFLVQASLPSLPLYKEGIDEIELLKELSYKGLKEKLAKYIKFLSAKQQITDSDIKKLETEYSTRLNFEIDIINKMKFAGYFLIVADFINWAKKNDIPVGPGRGSGAGSLVAWALNITDINPMQFGLFFERFLNPERISMPDFDVDFCQQRRDEVINYVVEKYGSEKVAQIITFGSLQTRAALRDVGRVLGLPYASVDKICKRIPYSTPSNPINIAKVLKEEVELQKDVEQFYMLKYLFEIALKLENLYRNVSTHAAGLVISLKPLVEVIPLYKDLNSSNNLPVSGFSMKYIEEVGLIKFDFLGLKTLTVIHGTLKRINEIHNNKINIEDIPLENVDKITKLLASGKTLGIFQLESLGMREVLKQLKPDKIEDIIAIISLYRPGPMENIPSYIKRKHCKEKVEYLHPLMEDILKETFGIMIYQEQVMKIAQKLAGYSLGEADLLRRAMGKKKPEEMVQHKSKFINGASVNNINEKLAGLIFDQMEKFAGYGFNKSHAAAYAFISWQTAYLKSFYPAEFIAESMTYDMQDVEKIAILLEDAKEFDIKVLPPDVNYANTAFIPFKDKNGNLFIRYSILAIKGTSKNLVEEIHKEVNKNGCFTSIENFLSRISSSYLNKKQLEALIKSGSLDSLEENRGKLLGNIDLLLDFNNKAFVNNKEQNLLFDIFNTEVKNNLILKDIKDLSLKEKLSMEADVIGFFISGHPLADYESSFEKLHIVKYNKLIEEEITNANLAIVVLKIKNSKTRNNLRYITLNCSDISSNFSIILFGKSYDNFATKVQEGGIYKIKVTARYDGTEAKLFVENLQDIVLVLQISMPSIKDKLYKLQTIMNNSLDGPTPIILKLLFDNNSNYKLLELGYKRHITKEIRNSLSSFAKIEEVLFSI